MSEGIIALVKFLCTLDFTSLLICLFTFACWYTWKNIEEGKKIAKEDRELYINALNKQIENGNNERREIMAQMKENNSAFLTSVTVITERIESVEKKIDIALAVREVNK